MLDNISKKSFATLLVVSMIILMMPAMAAAATDWDQFHADDGNSGYSPDEAPDTNNTLWTNSTTGAVVGSSPIIVNNKVYLNCNDKIEAFNVNNGAYNEGQSGPANGTYWSWASPCWDDARGIAVSPLSSSCNGGPLAIKIDNQHSWVVQSDFSGQYVCYENEYDIEEEVWVEDTKWTFNADGNAQGTPAYDGDYFYLTSYEYDWSTKETAGHVYCVNSSGGLEWEFEIDDPICGSVALDCSRDRVYVPVYTFNANESGAIYALNKTSGEEVWNETISRTDSTPAIDNNGNVYICGGYRGVEALKTYSFEPDGDLRWETNANDEIGDWICSPAVADGKVFVGKATTETDEWGYYTIGHDGTYALNASTGAVIWSYPYGGSSPAVYNGILVTIGDDGTVYAFRDV